MSRPMRVWVSNSPEVLYRALTLAEAFREFGLHHEQIWGAAAQGKVHPIAMPPSDGRSRKGQTRYPEWELRKLADELGVQPPPVIELPRRGQKYTYVERLAA